MKNNGLAFSDWLASNHNPLRHASNIAQHFANDALRAAFDAGQLYEKRLRKDNREANRTDNFSFEDANEQR